MKRTWFGTPGDVFARGALGEASWKSRPPAEDLPLYLTLRSEGDSPARVSWSLRSASPLEASWTLPAAPED